MTTLKPPQPVSMAKAFFMLWIAYSLIALCCIAIVRADEPTVPSCMVQAHRNGADVYKYAQNHGRRDGRVSALQQSFLRRDVNGYRLATYFDEYDQKLYQADEKEERLYTELPQKLTYTGWTHKVIDGDTLYIFRTDDNPDDPFPVLRPSQKCRLAYIDAPEFEHWSFGRHWGYQPFASEALRYVQDFLQEEEYTVYVVGYDGKDKRPVVVIVKAGVNLNRLLVAKGLAWNYPEFNKGKNSDPELAGIEATSIKEGAGLHRYKDATRPATWRKKEMGLVKLKVANN